MDKFTSPNMVQNMCANAKKFKGKIGKLARIVENADGCKQMAASSSTAHLKITKTHTKAEASAAQK